MTDIFPSPFQKNYEMLKDDQFKAVNTNDKNILISASAGTGKSFVLVNRLLKRILCHELEIDEVVVMTFTKDAAAELQVKLMKALSENRDAARSVGDRETEEYLTSQIAKLPSASISTIHSFCFDLVRKYGYAIGMDPDGLGNVMDDSDTALYQQMALEKIQSEVLKYPDLITTFCTRPESLDPLNEKITALAAKRFELPDYQSWKKKVFRLYDDIENSKDIPLLSQIAVNDVIASLPEAINSCERMIEFYHDMLTYTVLNNKNDPDQLLGYYLDFYNSLKSNQSDLSWKDIVNGYELLQTRTFNFPGLKNLDEDDKKTFEALKKEVKALCEKIKEARENFETLPAICRKTRKTVEDLFTLSELYYDTLQQLKAEAGLISFDDMGTLAIEILKHENIANEVRNKYKEIMVDEYQDSSNEQEELVQLIANGNNVFRVGDIKQAIYGFRGTKPEIMMNLIRNITENDALYHLKTSFRSADSVIKFSNYLFNVLMNLQNEETYVPDNDDLELAPKNKEKNTKVEIQKLDFSEEYNIAEKRDMLCKFVAADIQSLVESGKRKYGDFMLLVRKNRHKEMLRDYFSSYGMPAIASVKHGFFNDEAVSTVVSLLHLLLDESDQIHLINVLRGPLFNYTDDDLAAYYLDNGQITLSEESSLTSGVCELLKRLKETASLTELMIAIFKENNFYLEKISSKQRDNLDSLFRLVTEFLKNETGLSNLVYYLDKQSTSDREEATSLAAGDNAIRVMTIHQSKGLSAKYVYLIDFNTKPKTSDGLCDDELGVAVELIYAPENVRVKNPLKDYFIKKKKIQEDIAEEIRLLYVAVTRAEDQLKFIYFENKPLKALSFSALHSSNYATWIMGAIEHEAETSIKNFCVIKEPVTSFTELPEVSVKDTFRHIDVLPPATNSKAEEMAVAHGKDYSVVYPLNYDKPSGAARGTAMHRAIELLGIRRITMDDINELNLPLGYYDKKQIMAFYENDFTVSLMDNENRHEYPYISLVNGIPSNGVIDLYSESPDTSYIIDFKSDKYITEDDLKERYTAQLKTYADIIRASHKNKEVKAYIYSFYLNRYIYINTD